MKYILTKLALPLQIQTPQGFGVPIVETLEEMISVIEQYYSTFEYAVLKFHRHDPDLQEISFYITLNPKHPVPILFVSFSYIPLYEFTLTQNESEYPYKITNCPKYEGHKPKTLSHEVCKNCGAIQYYH